MRLVLRRDGRGEELVERLVRVVAALVERDHHVAVAIDARGAEHRRGVVEQQLAADDERLRRRLVAVATRIGDHGGERGAALHVENAQLFATRDRNGTRHARHLAGDERLRLLAARREDEHLRVVEREQLAVELDEAVFGQRVDVVADAREVLDLVALTLDDARAVAVELDAVGDLRDVAADRVHARQLVEPELLEHHGQSLDVLLLQLAVGVLLALVADQHERELALVALHRDRRLQGVLPDLEFGLVVVALLLEVGLAGLGVNHQLPYVDGIRATERRELDEGVRVKLTDRIHGNS